ncbi:SWIM zinc finger family protein [Niallia sp. FSL W8-1348]|uniref:SWIM zinc finger family protein n=1 Tax=Niallia sp. FSL W8-1348 TaxID=2954656 RepID=UPI0030FB19A0
MNINHFENDINKTIVDRGYSYYIEGYILEVYEKADNEYIFLIEGSDDYEVVVQLGDDGEILYSECDCPYDFGPVCKHEVAAYFQLFEMVNHVTTTKNDTNMTNKRTTIHEVLSNLSKEELIHIIINCANHDATFEKSLIVKYSNGYPQQELAICQELIHSIVRKYTGREGFIKYRDTGAFVREMEDVIDKARNTENVLVALDITLLLLEEAIAAFQYADDSSGDIGYLVRETLELLAEMVTSRVGLDHQSAEIFEKLLAQTDNEVFEGWLDYKIDLLTICFGFADDERHREQLKNKIESMIDNKSRERYTYYNNESMLQLLFQLIVQYGSQDEADQFIHEHLQFSSFREQLLNKYLQEKNYHKVIEVAKEGETQDQQYPGLLSKWKKFRYAAYTFLALKEEQQVLAKELLLAGDFEYYRDLKELAKENQDVSSFYRSIKNELKTEKGWHTNRIFLKLIEEENDLEEMLDFVENNPSYIEDYAEKLVKVFKEEVIEIYKKYIHSIASISSNRRAYQGVCHKITRYKKIAGKPQQVELINELIGLYKKRPAFIDELGKIKSL